MLQAEPRRAVDLSRLTGLSDGIFAVAMTVLVASLPVSGTPNVSAAQSLSDTLEAVVPQVKVASAGFFISALYWWRHHELMRTLARCDVPMMWLNFLVLFGVVLMPFTMRLAGTFPQSALTANLYAGNFAFNGAMLAALWGYAAAHKGFLKPEADADQAHRVIIGLASFVLIFLISMLVAWINVDLAPLSWLLLVPAQVMRKRLAGLFARDV
jgi:uncharacterized membrane protein